MTGRYEKNLHRQYKEDFLFRRYPDSSRFYESGTPLTGMVYQNLPVFSNNTSASVCALPGSRSKEDSNESFPFDIYAIRAILNNYQYSVCDNDYNVNEILNAGRFKSILTPNNKDDHSSALCHIVDTDTQSVLVSIFINSSISEYYYQYTLKRFNMSKSYSLENLDSRYLQLKFQNFHWHQEGKTVYLQKGDRKKELFELFPDSITITEKITLIDASHDLQKEINDQNCVLYGINFLTALKAMLEQRPDIGEQAFQLAKQIDAGDDTVQNKLASLFADGLKPWLPCYYTEDRQPKSDEEIRDFHLHQRWDLDSTQLAIQATKKDEEVDKTFSQSTCCRLM